MTGWIQAIEHVAQIDPERPALSAPLEAPLSYASLLNQMQTCAAVMASHGLDRHARVAVMLPAGLGYASAVLSVMYHAVCIPLNPQTSAAELHSTLARSGARALVLPADGFEEARSVARALGLLVLVSQPGPDAAFTFALEGSAPLPTGLNALVASPSDASTAALILHTSGSTGEPKRVVLSHGQLAASARNVANHLRLNRFDIAINVMPLFHSHGLVGVLLSSLTAGASVVVLEGFEPTAFCEAIAAHGPTWYSASPTIHISVLEHISAYRERAPQHQFRFVRSTSSALPQPILERLESALNAPVIESFGMTEWSQMASNPLPPGQRKVGSVGKATGVELALLKDGDLVLPLSGDVRLDEGELLVRGADLAKAYEGDAEATAAAWIDGWFRTGDVARVDEDGCLYMVGRLKDLINRGGEKISPLEIEAALLRHPAVHDAVAFGVPHPTLGEDLGAAVCLHAGTQTNAVELREYLFGQLADFKVPSEIHIASAIPRSATGKVRRSDMATQFTSAAAQSRDEPLTPLQSDVAAIWCAVLHRERVQLDDNFFKLGGDSLSGMRVVGRINKQLGIKVQPSLLFRHPTLRGLTDQIAPPPAPPETQSLESSIAQLSDEEVMRLLAIEEQRAAERAT